MNTDNALVAVDSGRMLSILEAGCRSLAQAKDAREALDLRDQAEAMRHWAKQRGLSIQAVNDAAELKLWAERRLGEMLVDMPKHNGDPRLHDATRLSDLGLDKVKSHRFQKVASVPLSTFTAHIAEVREAGEEITTAGVYALAKAARKEAKGAVIDEEARNGCTVDDLWEEAKSGRKYGTIYADPPWAYGNQGTRASTGDHYQTMSIEEIAALPVKDLAAEACHLHLWTTNAFVREAFGLMDAWGFGYKSMFIWCKPQMGIGNYWRVSHEIMLLGVKGDARSFADHSMKSWAEIDRAAHSAKPEQVRLMIERASPGPRLELFARIRFPGWRSWGNGIGKDLWTREAKEAEG